MKVMCHKCREESKKMGESTGYRTLRRTFSVSGHTGNGNYLDFLHLAITGVAEFTEGGI